MFDQLLYAWDDSVDRMAAGWRELEARLLETGYSLPFVYLTSTCSPAMWDNGPPNPFLPELVAKWNESELGPIIRYATFDDLLQRVRVISDDDIESLSGDWTDYWSFGLGSAPIATALSRRGKHLLSAASTLSGGRPHPAASRAAELIDLYDEHTFGFWDTADDHPQTQTIEMLKQALAHEGYELASFAVMDALEQLAGNPLADRQIAAVLLCNASSEPVVIRPEIPDSWIGDQPVSSSRTYRASRMTYANRTWETSPQPSETQRFGPVELAPLSWRIVPIDRLPEANEAGAIVHRTETKAGSRQDPGFLSVAAHGGEETAHLAGNGAIAIPTDVTEPDSIQRAIATAAGLSAGSTCCTTMRAARRRPTIPPWKRRSTSSGAPSSSTSTAPFSAAASASPS